MAFFAKLRKRYRDRQLKKGRRKAAVRKKRRTNRAIHNRIRRVLISTGDLIGRRFHQIHLREATEDRLTFADRHGNELIFTITDRSDSTLGVQTTLKTGTRQCLGRTIPVRSDDSDASIRLLAQERFVTFFEKIERHTSKRLFPVR